MQASSVDIISEVAAAADPARAAAARRRLEAMSNSGNDHFALLVAASSRAVDKPVAAQAPTAFDATRRKVASRLQENADPVASAYRALGGVLLQKTFETMMPKLAGLSAASASASSIWSSMLAQQLAESASGSIFHLSRDPASAVSSRAAAAKAGVGQISPET